ncbi:RHS repeat domain-containing protein [Neisseria sp.]
MFKQGKKKARISYRRIGKGRLKDKEVSDGLEEETRFVWDGSHLLQEVYPDGRYTYIYTAPDSYEPLAQVHNRTNEEGESKQEINYFHCDQIGIPREMTDKDGNLLWFGDYYGWGRLKNETNVTGTAHQPFRLQNQYCDRETGLHYNFFRYYDPHSGRFINQDPIGLMGGSNFYQFSTNTQNMIDPWGLNAVGVAKGVLSMIAIDTMTPDPSDVAWPKWIAYGVLGAAATGVVALSESDTCTGKCQEEKKRKKCLDATVDNIKMVTAKTSYLTLQKSVSIPAVARYTALIERGSIAPPVKMDGNTIVDGNHRMVAGLLCNQIPASTPGTAPLSKPRIPLRDIQPDPIDWW